MDKKSVKPMTGTAWIKKPMTGTAWIKQNGQWKFHVWREGKPPLVLGDDYTDVLVWDRALTPEEIKEVYDRTAKKNR